jgi:hypothetical protein
MALKGGPKRGLVLAKFINADKPVPPVIEILYNEGQMGQVAFRFAKTGQPIPPGQRPMNTETGMGTSHSRNSARQTVCQVIHTRQRGNPGASPRLQPPSHDRK